MNISYNYLSKNLKKKKLNQKISHNQLIFSKNQRKTEKNLHRPKKLNNVVKSTKKKTNLYKIKRKKKEIVSCQGIDEFRMMHK